MRGTVLVLVMTVVVAAAYVPPTWACSCMPPPAPLEAKAQMDGVFSGTVLSVEGLEPGEMGIPVEVTLDVHTIWKGDPGAKVVVRTANNSAACGFNFEEGQQYLVYAHQEDGEWTTNLCTRTAELSRASADLDALGEGADAGGAAAKRCGGPTGLGALQAIFITMLGTAVLRRRHA